jgi:hypothetical protein
LDENLIDRSLSGYHALHKKKGHRGTFVERVEKGKIARDSILFVEGQLMRGLGIRMDGIEIKMTGLNNCMDGFDNRLHDLNHKMDGIALLAEQRTAMMLQLLNTHATTMVNSASMIMDRLTAIDAKLP